MANEDHGMKTAVEETSADASDQTPPQEIILEVFMHCEGCARKVKKSLIGFNGVEDVSTDCKNRRVVVRGDIANPLDVVNRIKKKTHRQVQLLYPIPTSDSNSNPTLNPAQAENPNSDINPYPSSPSQELEEIKSVSDTSELKDKDDQEAKVATMVIKINMHCEACAAEIKRRIETMEGVETATPDLQKSEVTVTGTFDPPNLLDFVYKKTGKHSVIIKQEPYEVEEEISKDNEITEEENKEEEEAAEENKDEENVSQEMKEDAEEVAAVEEQMNPAEMAMAMDLRRNWNNGGMYNYYYPPMHGMEMYGGYSAPPPPPPQMFNDENSNACSVM